MAAFVLRGRQAQPFLHPEPPRPMITFDLTFFAIAIPAILFAAISKSGFGSGAAFAAAPILALVLDPAVALGVVLPLLMLVDVSSLKPYWGKWHAPSAKVLIIGAVPGIALAIWLFQVANPDIFRLLIGGISIGFVLFQLGRARGIIRIAPQPFRPVLGAFFGVIAGFTSFVSHAGGPPAAIFLLSQNLSKTTFQATTVITFWIINILKAVPYAIIGVFTAETLLAGLYLAPFALLGTWLGVKAHHLIPERVFFVITYVLLTCTGSKLIYDALT